jgi:hypothetical protein
LKKNVKKTKKKKKTATSKKKGSEKKGSGASSASSSKTPKSNKAEKTVKKASSSTSKKTTTKKTAEKKTSEKSSEGVILHPSEDEERAIQEQCIQQMKALAAFNVARAETAVRQAQEDVRAAQDLYQRIGRLDTKVTPHGSSVSYDPRSMIPLYRSDY